MRNGDGSFEYNVLQIGNAKPYFNKQFWEISL